MTYIEQSELDKRRNDVASSIEEATIGKLSCGETAEATDEIEKAYKKATEEPIIDSPWPEVAAYRLAHLMLRKGDLTEPELRRADQLFKEADSTNATLGPWPLIYRLATLHRLGHPDPDVHLRAAVARLLEQHESGRRKAGMQTAPHNCAGLEGCFQARR